MEMRESLVQNAVAPSSNSDNAFDPPQSAGQIYRTAQGVPCMARPSLSEMFASLDLDEEDATAALRRGFYDSKVFHVMHWMLQIAIVAPASVVLSASSGASGLKVCPLVGPLRSEMGANLTLVALSGHLLSSR